MKTDSDTEKVTGRIKGKQGPSIIDYSLLFLKLRINVSFTFISFRPLKPPPSYSQKKIMGKGEVVLFLGPTDI